MKLAAIYLASISITLAYLGKSIHAERVSADLPTAERVRPNMIEVHGAHWAGIDADLDSWSIIEGHWFDPEYAWSSEDGTILYEVDPFQDFVVQAFTQDTVIWPDESDPNRQRFEFDIPSTIDDKLDWLMFERIRWEIRFNDFIEEHDLNNFDISESRNRVLGWYQSEIERTQQ